MYSKKMRSSSKSPASDKANTRQATLKASQDNLQLQFSATRITPMPVSLTKAGTMMPPETQLASKFFTQQNKKSSSGSDVMAASRSRTPQPAFQSAQATKFFNAGTGASNSGSVPVLQIGDNEKKTVDLTSSQIKNNSQAGQSVIQLDKTSGSLKLARAARKNGKVVEDLEPSVPKKQPKSSQKSKSPAKTAKPKKSKPKDTEESKNESKPSRKPLKNFEDRLQRAEKPKKTVSKEQEESGMQELLKIKKQMEEEKLDVAEVKDVPVKRSKPEDPVEIPQPSKRKKGSDVFSGLLKTMDDKKEKPCPFPNQIQMDVSELRDILDASRAKTVDRDMRYSMRNDLSEFYNFILTLDIFDINNTKLEISRRHIPEVFTDGADYISSFRNLYLEEVRSEIEMATQLIDFSNPVELTLKHKLGLIPKNGFFLEPENSMEFQDRFKPDDLLLVMDANVSLPRRFTKGFRPDCAYFLAIVECSNNRRQTYLRVYENQMLNDYIRQNPEWIAVSVDSMITLLREFKMIQLAEFLDCSRYILQPAAVFPTSPTKIPEGFFTIIQKHFNSSQYSAIRNVCTQDRGFTLLQGPPGTGKTHTILGILSAFMDSEALSGDRPYILVCAPSNAAIDELASRVIRYGLIDINGRARHNLNLVRIGSRSQNAMALRDQKDSREREYLKKSISEDLQKIFLANLVNEKITQADSIDHDLNLRQTTNKLKAVLRALDEAKRNNKHPTLIAELEEKKRAASSAKKVAQSALESQRAKRFKLEKELTNDADIIFATLSMAGGREFEKITHNFDYVIIDEACQSIELSALIPLQYNAKKIVLVGDPMQLPATIFSHRASRLGLNQSLFERMSKAGCEVTMLEIQYRMVPEIRAFPSATFYANRLQDGNVISTRRGREWIPSNCQFLFFNLENSQEQRQADETSYDNATEGEFVTSLYNEFEPWHGSGLNIGIITPYKRQVSTIRNNLVHWYHSSYKQDIEINTVDGFQGREKDFIIFSCVRSRDRIGFLSDFRRMNVAITRAKYALWVVGRANTLMKDQYWKQLVEHAENTGCFYNVHSERAHEIEAIIQSRN